MKLPLRKLATIIFISLLGLNTYAEAKSPTPKLVIAKKPYNAGKAKSHIVQIFSSASATKAEGMKNTLEMHGYPAFINIKAQQTQSFYQVQIGPFRSKYLANSAKTSIIKRYPEFIFLNEAILKIAYKNQ